MTTELERRVAGAELARLLETRGVESLDGVGGGEVVVQHQLGAIPSLVRTRWSASAAVKAQTVSA